MKTDQLETVFKWRVQRLNLFIVPIVVVLVAVFIYLKLPFNCIQYTIIAYGALFGQLFRRYYPDTSNKPLIQRAFALVTRKRLK